MRGCSSTTARSSGDNADGLRRMRSLIPIFPMSCSSEPKTSSSRVFLRPSSRSRSSSSRCTRSLRSASTASLRPVRAPPACEGDSVRHSEDEERRVVASIEEIRASQCRHDCVDNRRQKQQDGDPEPRTSGPVLSAGVHRLDWITDRGITSSGRNPVGVTGYRPTLLQVQLHGVRAKRLREKVPRGQVAPHLVEPFELGLRLHALGDRSQAQDARQGEGARDDLDSLEILSQPLDERAVDLEVVHRQTLQVRERRAPGPEIVDRQPDAHALELLESPDSVSCVLHYRVLGYLEHEVTRRETGLSEYLGDEVGLLELLYGEVHAEKQGRGALSRLLPRLRLHARFAEYPLPDRNDQASLFRE